MANTKSKITLSAELRPGPHSWNEIPVMRDVSLWVKEPSVCAVGWGVGAGSCLEFSCVLPQSLLLALWVRHQVVRGMFHPLQRVLGARKPLWRPPFLQGTPYELLMSLTREKTQRWLWRAVTDVALCSDPCDPCFRIRFRLVPQPTAGLSDPSRELLSDEGDTPSWVSWYPVTDRWGCRVLPLGFAWDKSAGSAQCPRDPWRHLLWWNEVQILFPCLAFFTLLQVWFPSFPTLDWSLIYT